METGTKSDKIRVLLVDDNPDLLEITQLHLSAMGFLVFAATNANDAMKVITSAPIDVVLSDIRMPGCDGIQLLKRIREESVRVPGLLFITGFADLLPNMQKEDLEKHGVFEILTKPVDRNRLYCAVVAAAAATRARLSAAA